MYCVPTWHKKYSFYFLKLTCKNSHSDYLLLLAFHIQNLPNLPNYLTKKLITLMLAPFSAPSTLFQTSPNIRNPPIIHRFIIWCNRLLFAWDQIAYWACKIVTAVPESLDDILPKLGTTMGSTLRGNASLGSSTLSRFTPFIHCRDQAPLYYFYWYTSACSASKVYQVPL